MMTTCLFKLSWLYSIFLLQLKVKSCKQHSSYLHSIYILAVSRQQKLKTYIDRKETYYRCPNSLQKLNPDMFSLSKNIKFNEEDGKENRFFVIRIGGFRTFRTPYQRISVATYLEGMLTRLSRGPRSNRLSYFHPWLWRYIYI